MKNETQLSAAQQKRQARAAALRARMKNFQQGRRASKLGSNELIALVSAFALLALTLAAYFLYLAPARARLVALQRERSQLQNTLREATEGTTQSESAQATVGSILQSLERFEAVKLAQRGVASTAVIEELNEKTRRHNLTRAQMSFTYLEERAPAQTTTQSVSASGRRQNIFPGIDISLTVDGAYANIRRFIRDIEASERFLVINGVQLEGVNESGAGAQRGALVSLRLDMSAFFRRVGAIDATGATTTAPASTSQ